MIMVFFKSVLNSLKSILLPACQKCKQTNQYTKKILHLQKDGTLTSGKSVLMRLAWPYFFKMFAVFRFFHRKSSFFIFWLIHRQRVSEKRLVNVSSLRLIMSGCFLYKIIGHVPYLSPSNRTVTLQSQESKSHGNPSSTRRKSCWTSPLCMWLLDVYINVSGYLTLIVILRCSLPKWTLTASNS